LLSVSGCALVQYTDTVVYISSAENKCKTLSTLTRLVFIKVTGGMRVRFRPLRSHSEHDQDYQYSSVNKIINTEIYQHATPTTLDRDFRRSIVN
jgi:hypothetical protein